MQLTTNELIKVVEGKAIGISYDNIEIAGISVDSRTIRKNEVFFAIKGEKYDGHDFLDEVQEKEGVFSVIEKDENSRGVLVKDTKLALCHLARYYRSKFKPLTIAITGSNGKTTSKRLTNLVLRQRFNVLSSPRSYNNEIGVPLTIFKLQKENEVLLLEFGMNHKHEIKHLSDIAKPDIGVITNIAPVHIANFSSIDEILREKIQLARSCNTILLNADDDMLMGALEDINSKKVITFGIKTGDIRAVDITLDKSGSKFKLNNNDFFLPLFGKHNIYNALVSIALGDILGVGRTNSMFALMKATPENGRDKQIYINNSIIVDSTYNSNPVSLISSLEGIRLIKGRKIAVIGDMLELGKKSTQYHREVGKRLKELDIQALFTYGELAREIAEYAMLPFISSYYDIDKLIRELKKFIIDGDVILVKGSRKMKMERVVEELCGMLNVE